MTVSAYHVDSVIRAYNKQMRMNNTTSAKQEDAFDEYRDTVQLSSGDGKKEVYEKITYSLVDIILNKK